MPNTTIASGVTQTARIDMSGTDTLTLVDSTSTLSVSANGQSVRFNGATNGATITNNGTIENTAAGGGRAIRFESTVGASLTATITNSFLIQSGNDAIQVDSG